MGKRARRTAWGVCRARIGGMSSRWARLSLGNEGAGGSQDLMRLDLSKGPHRPRRCGSLGASETPGRVRFGHLFMAALKGGNERAWSGAAEGGCGSVTSVWLQAVVCGGWSFPAGFLALGKCGARSRV